MDKNEMTPSVIFSIKARFFSETDSKRERHPQRKRHKIQKFIYTHRPSWCIFRLLCVLLFLWDYFYRVSLFRFSHFGKTVSQLVFNNFVLLCVFLFVF